MAEQINTSSIKNLKVSFAENVTTSIYTEQYLERKKMIEDNRAYNYTDLFPDPADCVDCNAEKINIILTKLDKQVSNFC